MDERVRAGAACDAVLWAERLWDSGPEGSAKAGDVDDGTPREVSAAHPDVLLVVTLAHCACVSKAWRDAVLRRLVRVLSPPFSPWSRAAAASALAAYSTESEALALIENNGIAPLLRLAQTAPRRKDLSPDPSVHPATLEMADQGIQALAMLAGVAERQLSAAGWTLLDPDELRKERGAAATELAEDLGPVYEHNESSHVTLQNPLLGSGSDATDLLQELPSLLSPQWMPKEKRVRWPATIRHHCVADGFCPSVDEDLTVVDEFVAAPAGEVDKERPNEELRQLVLGAWAGLTGFRETEWNLAEAPGENLYAWYTTALAAVLSLRIGTQVPHRVSAAGSKRRRPRILLIGLGGGSLATFFGYHYGSAIEMDVVERSGPVVDAAENFFGLRDHEGDHETEDDHKEGDARVTHGELPNGTRVQVQGLQNAVVHNGKVGTIASWVLARERYAVALDGKHGKMIHVRQENLHQLGAPAATQQVKVAAEIKQQTESNGDAWDVFDSASDEDDGGMETLRSGGKTPAENETENDAWGVFGSSSDSDNDDAMEVDEHGPAQESEPADSSSENEPVSRMTVYIEDALKFARRSAAAISAANEAHAASDGKCAEEGSDESDMYYDVILLDVYTQEHFPADLLSESFFKDLRCLLRRGSGEGKGGAEETAAGVIAVNVGGARAKGGGFDTVLQRLCGLSVDSSSETGEASPPPLRRVDVLLEDDTEPSQNDEDADPEEDLGTANAVLVGWGGGAMPPALSVDDWSKSAVVGNRVAAIAGGKPLPYRLGTCISEVYAPPPPVPLQQQVPVTVSQDQLGKLKRLLRPGVDDAAAAYLAKVEAAHNQSVLTRVSHRQLAELKSLLEPGRDDAAVKFLEDAESKEKALQSQVERLAKLQRVVDEPLVGSAQVVVAAAEAQTVVVHRLSFQEAEDNADGSITPENSSSTDMSLAVRQRATMAVGDAQKTAVIRVPGFLSPAEVAAVHAAAEKIVADKAAAAAAAAAGEVVTAPNDSITSATALAPLRSSPAWETGRKWNVSFLHKGGMFAKHLPEIRAKILELGRKADAENWGQIASADGLSQQDLAIRFVEYHRMVEGAGLANPKHYDSGSTVTIDIMLSDPVAGDFSGGTFQTLEVDGHLRPYQFELGDALVFVSHKYHCVAPVTAGRRRVLVTELFSGGGTTSGEEGEGEVASN